MDHLHADVRPATHSEAHSLALATASGAFHLEAYRRPVAKTDAAVAQPAGDIVTTARAIANGTSDGIAEVVRQGARSPGKTAVAVGIGIAEASLLAAGAKIVAAKEALPLIAGAAFALDVMPSLRPMRAGLVGVWSGTMSMEEASLAFRPLGHLAVTYGVARGTSQLASTRVFKPSLQVDLEDEREVKVASHARIDAGLYSESRYMLVNSAARPAGKSWLKPLLTPETK